ncbi:MAG: hypothetical protein BAJALOKI3v1_50025 [Promethearchaeota archaeon]|nr:MAG: hypothetical protein BAJALOKI3v1_50025 [Candidatus Lokiarchaeota archaeon]
MKWNVNMAINYDVDKFKEWFGEFIERHGGYAPTNLTKWLNNCEESHQHIRSIIGDYIYSDKFEIDNSKMSEKVLLDQDKILHEIKNKYSSFLPFADVSIDELRYSEISRGTHNVIKTSKHLLRCFKKYYGQTDKNFSSLISRLGQTWVDNDDESHEVHVTISTTPKSFVLLGHYGPDRDSCFRQGSDHTSDKFVLGQTQDTFIGTVAKYDPVRERYRNVARMLGYFDRLKKIYTLFNLYKRPNITESSALECIKRTIESLPNHKKLKFIDERKVVLYKNPDKFYINEYGGWFLSSDFSNSSSSSISIPWYIKGIKSEECHVCGKELPYRRIEELIVVDDKYCCSECARKANTCEHTGQLTFNDLVAVFLDMPHPNFINVSARVAREFKDRYRLAECQNCGSLHRKSTTNYCDNCVDDVIDYCDECGVTINIKNDKHYSNGTEVLCLDCYKNYIPDDMELINE